jgi:putative oxidoreductase
MKYIVVLGRFLYSLIFVLAAFGHFTRNSIDHAAAQGVWLPEILVPLSGVMCLVGGLSVMLGYKAKLGAWILFLFLVPVTLVMHQFWAFQDPITAMIERIMFMKNLSLIGGALLIAYFGSGPLSLKH